MFECPSRSLMFFTRFGMCTFWASVGQVTPNIGAAIFAFCKNQAHFLYVYMNFMKALVQLGSVLPDASAVYVRNWCVMFECSGPSLMFLCAFWYLFGLGGACYSPY